MADQKLKQKHLGRPWVFEAFAELATNCVLREYKKNPKCKNIYMDVNTLRSVYDLTVETIDFHLKLDEVVHYKECAHLCFWFSKLKPIFVLSSDLEEPVQASKSLDLNLRGVLSKRKVSQYKPHTDNIDSPNFASYFLNEKVALITAVTFLILIDTELLFEMDYDKVKRNSNDLKAFEKAQEETIAKSKFFDPKILNKLTYSLRFHNHSARSLASTFETIAISGEL